jgi:hypothetical protein
VPPALAKAPAAEKTPTLAPRAVAEIDPAGFAAFDYGSQTPAQAHVEARKDSEGRRWYSWPKAQSASPVTIYRRISSDEHEPYAPDQAELVAATTAAEPEATIFHVSS